MLSKGISAAALLLLVSVTAMAQEKSPPLLMVTGRAQTMADPDQAVVMVGAVEQGATAAEAQSKVNVIVQKLITAVQALGVDKKSIQTSRLTLMPLYAEPRPGQPPTVRGYQASNQVSVRLTDFALIGKVLDASVASGANEIQGVNFGLRDDLAARTAALKQAVAEARAKADAIADSLGMKVVSVFDVNESEGYMPQPMFMGGEAMMGKAADTRVEPGQLTVTGMVTIRFVIAPK